MYVRDVDVAVALGRPVVRNTVVNRANPGGLAGAQCRWTTVGGGASVEFQVIPARDMTTKGAFDTPRHFFKTNFPGVPVASVGDGATWSEADSTLTALKGNVVIRLRFASGQGPFPVQRATPLATAVLSDL